MNDEEHFVEVLAVYGTGDSRDGWNTEPGWFANDQTFFIATCWCGWESQMRVAEAEAFEDGRAHKPGMEPVRSKRAGGRFPA